MLLSFVFALLLLNTVELGAAQKAKPMSREASILKDAAKRATMSKTHVRKLKRRVKNNDGIKLNRSLKENAQEHAQDSIEQDDHEQSDGPRKCCCDWFTKNPVVQGAVLLMAYTSGQYGYLQQPIHPFPYVVPDRRHEIEFEEFMRMRAGLDNEEEEL